MKPIYLDYNATTPVLPEVISAFNLYAGEFFWNPSSGHILGRRAKEVLEEFRKTVAEALSAEPEEVIFTSGGTEANHLALFGVLTQYKKAHLLVSSFEHPSILNPAVKLLEKGYEVDFVPVNPQGYVEPDVVKKRLRPHTKLVSIILANNEIGTIQPIKEISEILKEREILFHTDACQAVGKIPVNFKELCVDMLTLAGHKMYAPKGIGALIVKKGVNLEPIFFGGGQERGLRAGTEPVPLIASLSKACEIAKRDVLAEGERLKFLRERLFQGLKEFYPDLYRFVDPEKTLPNTLTVSFVGKSGAKILSDLPEICASTGSACHDRKGSITLQALKVPPEIAEGTIRFSLGRYTTLEDIEKVLELFQNYFRK
ncbi:cysteine desulfurase [Caldimicrobium thiodismutans]|uniref:cysteine desulfurase n=1 Tax=Caldimicrobium thiodismutans TaxID=1653476 RepID=A0A0U5AI13_9BACT|nr:cysteine desulfurase family protein [Caldimicrobium thiodismutans]BAU23539.1 cysteine desulfurase [Caldimicrobium thiodismutans]